jgi:hypothetical protein
MILKLLIVAVIIGLFVLVVYGMISSEKKRLTRKKNAILALGFHPLENPDPALLKQLLSLYTKHEKQKLSLRNWYQRRESDYLLYLYEVWDEGSNDNHLHEEWGLAMSSLHLNLPRFSLIPKIDMPGKFAGLVNRFLEKLTVQGSLKIEFADHLPFSRRYMVTGQDELAVRKFFNPRLLNRLSDTSFLLVDGDKNLLTFSKYDLEQGKRNGKKEHLNSRLQEARSFFQLILEEVTAR